MSSAGIVDGAVAPFTSRAAADVRGSSIGFEHVSVAYKGTVVLRDFTLAVTPGEIMALLGPSGSGKTTALRAVAGFVRPASGRVTIGEEDVTHTPPYARGIGMVVQNYALFPHMRVVDNVAFGLKARRESRALIAERVRDCLAMVGMTAYAERYPQQLSGGQQQRVAIARALAIRPRVLLLDEPLSALDAQIRRAMVEEIAELHRDLPHLTVLYVTHDQAEALTLADRITIMRDGRLSATGEARSLYDRPPNRFAAEFLGRANVLPVRIEAIDGSTGEAEVSFGEARLKVAAGRFKAGESALLCVRPHDLKFAPPVGGGNAITGTLAAGHWHGETEALTIDCNGVALRLVRTPQEGAGEPGTRIRLYFASSAAVLIGDEPAHA
jgi:2-aminoethylphosphonate transport system ATP-binding protein